MALYSTAHTEPWVISLLIITGDWHQLSNLEHTCMHLLPTVLIVCHLGLPSWSGWCLHLLPQNPWLRWKIVWKVLISVPFLIWSQLNCQSRHGSFFTKGHIPFLWGSESLLGFRTVATWTSLTDHKSREPFLVIGFYYFLLSTRVGLPCPRLSQAWQCTPRYVSTRVQSGTHQNSISPNKDTCHQWLTWWF